MAVYRSVRRAKRIQLTPTNQTYAKIDALHEAWRGAFQRKDVDAITGFLTPDYTLWAPGKPPTGRQELQPRLAATLAAYEIVPEFEREERIVLGDLAFEQGWECRGFGFAQAGTCSRSGSACS